MSILSRFGARQLPTFRGLQQQIVKIARYEFLTQLFRQFRLAYRNLIAVALCVLLRISRCFNGPTGMSRRPIGHIYFNLLELSSSYRTYREFQAVLLSKEEAALRLDGLRNISNFRGENAPFAHDH